jgi:hypothetical protein
MEFISKINAAPHFWNYFPKMEIALTLAAKSELRGERGERANSF